MRMTSRLAAIGAAAFLMSSPAIAAGPKIVSGPGADTQCFKPWNNQTKFFQWPAKKGPYRIALANGYVGNTWRIQMIKTAKAYAELPEVKPEIKDFKVVSVGVDAAAQLGSIEDFINQGYDAIIINAVSTTGFDRVIRQANAKGVVLVPFDNQLDTDQVMQVNEDNHQMGVLGAQWLLKYVGSKGNLLEVRGVPGNSVDRDRHEGFQDTLKKAGNFNITEVVGNWATGDSQKVTADAIAVHGHFDGVFTQGGSDGTVQAFIDAKQPMVPMSGEGENNFRKQIADHAKDGLKGMSYGQSPALVAISIKAAISALKGNAMPQLISIPIPVADFTNLKAGENYFPNLNEQFFADNAFPPCGVNFTAPQIMSQSEKNTQ
ncbi:MAG TPA: sugar ABC transporter substrate-binding protein [Acetobacteraceae bacterium]|nr:sugar ABC transporter substrate-binding protein [Acetobacteraceae bacterium]